MTAGCPLPLRTISAVAAPASVASSATRATTASTSPACAGDAEMLGIRTSSSSTPRASAVVAARAARISSSAAVVMRPTLTLGGGLQLGERLLHAGAVVRRTVPNPGGDRRRPHPARSVVRPAFGDEASVGCVGERVLPGADQHPEHVHVEG